MKGVVAARHASLRVAPQSWLMDGQVRNNAGGGTFAVDCKHQYMRFLKLGSVGGTYYVGACVLGTSAVNVFKAVADEDPEWAVDQLVDVSVRGLCASNDYPMFALAFLCGHWKGQKDKEELLTRAILQVVRTGYHMIEFRAMLKEMRGGGRLLRRMLRQWYLRKDADQLSYQLLKYRRRGNRTHKFALQTARPRPRYKWQSILFRYASGADLDDVADELSTVSRYAAGYVAVRRASSPKDVARIIKDFDLTWEAVPASWLAYDEVWDALIPRMPIEALLRNLGQLTRRGLLRPLCERTSLVCRRIREEVPKSRLHPIVILMAHKVYTRGGGIRGKLNWEPVHTVVDALDDVVERSFSQVSPTGANLMYALDVSHSMSYHHAGYTCLSAAEAGVALVVQGVRAEKNVFPMAFSSEFKPLNITKRTSLREALKLVPDINYGATDCAQPMLYAIENKLDVDAFIIITDNETWIGDIHPYQALERYRAKMNKPKARMIVVAMVPTQFTIADPNDMYSLDIAGFDAQTPRVINEFIRGELVSV